MKSLCAFIIALGAIAAMGGVSLGAQTGKVFHSPRFVPATYGELGKSVGGQRTVRTALLADRMVYHADDTNGQLYALFLGKMAEGDAERLEIVLELKDAKGAAVATEAITPVREPKLSVLIAVKELATGEYTAIATLREKGGKVIDSASVAFGKTADRDNVPDFPAEGITIAVHPQAHVANAAWPISTGVPMPKAILTDCDELALLEDGKPVAAQFSTRSTWTPKGDVKWVGVDFLARYDNGNPRAYRLVRNAKARVAPQRPMQVTEEGDSFAVDTGMIRFLVGKKRFAGIEKAWIDRNHDGTYSDDEMVVSGKGGSFVVDDSGTRYDSAHDAETQVVVEERGPVRVSIAAKGWCVSEQDTKLCQYVVRIHAYAGQPLINVSHRIVNTIADQYDDTKLVNVGFEIAGARPTTARFGLDGVGEATYPAAAGKAFFAHQARDDHFRLLEGDQPVKEGKQLSGWACMSGPNGGVGIFLRDIWQKFPRELEASFAADGAGKLVLHFWPKHGSDAFTDEEELARNQIYKVRWAHEGKALEMRIPDKYHERLKEYDAKERWSTGGDELAIVDKKTNTAKIQMGSGQGSVLGSEFIISLQASAASAEQTKAMADLVQQSPGALSDPAWNCATNVFGSMAPRNPEKWGRAEKIMDVGYPSYRRAIIEGGREYGMWIYGAIHSAWLPDIDAADLVRTWQMSHYQNVFQAWLLYFRSGLPEHFEWARLHSNQHLDVGVCNYLKYPLGAHPYGRLPDIGGNIYHCKGFMPWAGNSSTTGHFIDITNYLARYYMTGDRRGLDMAEQWMGSMGILAGSPAPVLPDPMKINPREVLVPLGEMVQYYEGTWDPQALIRIEALAQNLDVPFVKTNSPSVASFGKHWQDWYYDLTRDPRVIQRISEFVTDKDYFKSRTPSFPSFAAFLYRTTGDTSLLRQAASDAYGETRFLYENAGDRYDGWCGAFDNPSSMLLGRLPFLFAAMDAAGMKLEPAADTGRAVMPSRGGRVDRLDKWPMPTRGWSNAGVTVLADAGKPRKLLVSIDGPKGYGAYRGHYMLFAGWPKLGLAFERQAMAAARKEQEARVVTFPDKNIMNDPPTERNVIERRGDDVQVYPYVEKAENPAEQQLYHLEYSGDNIYLPAILDAATGEPVAQIGVIARSLYNGQAVAPAPWRVKGVMRSYMRALDERAVINVKAEAVFNRYWRPTAVRIVDAKGQTVIDDCLFMAGTKKTMAVALDPAKHPSPWMIEVASFGDCRFGFDGAEELLFAVGPEDFDAIVTKLAESQK